MRTSLNRPATGQRAPLPGSSLAAALLTLSLHTHFVSPSLQTAPLTHKCHRDLCRPPFEAYRRAAPGACWPVGDSRRQRGHNPGGYIDRLVVYGPAVSPICERNLDRGAPDSCGVWQDACTSVDRVKKPSVRLVATPADTGLSRDSREPLTPYIGSRISHIEDFDGRCEMCIGYLRLRGGGPKKAAKGGKQDKAKVYMYIYNYM